MLARQNEDVLRSDDAVPDDLAMPEMEVSGVFNGNIRRNSPAILFYASFSPSSGPESCPPDPAHPPAGTPGCNDLMSSAVQFQVLLGAHDD